MGLLSRAAGGVRRALHDTGLPGVPAFNALAGAGIGAGMDAKFGDDGIGEGALGGALLGAGIGLGGGGRQLVRNVGEMLAERNGLEAIKREALAWVRNSPRAQRAVMAARSEQEIDDIVYSVISTQRVRPRGT